MAARMSRSPAIGEVRLADHTDIPYIHEFCNESISKTFRIEGRHDIKYLIENAVLSVTQMNVYGEVIGFLSCREYPLIPAVHPTAWEEYIWTKYKAIDMNGRNTLFIHLMCWNRAYCRDLVDNMLKSVFMHDPYVHYIGMVKSVVSCPQLVPGSSRVEASFKRLQAMERGMSSALLPALLVAERRDVCPRLRVRRAVEEDNDDIVPIIERHSGVLRDLYGDFYISELIARHPESDRVLVVCEHKELAVGIMCLNTVINFESLEENYDLSPFAGLRHLDRVPCKRNSKEIDEASLSVLSDFHGEWPESGGDSGTIMKGRVSKVSFDDEAIEEDKLDEEDDVEYSLQALLQLFDDEEEEMEFDIVNIDLSLLRSAEYTAPEEDLTKNMLPRASHHDSMIQDDMKKKKTGHTGNQSPSQKQTERIIRYSGESNAFLLELFAMHEDYDERYGFDMLEAAFELFPGKDYCVICLPSSHSAFPLLEHFTLVTPRTSHARFMDSSLYVAHVNSVKGDVSVRPGELYDMDILEDILEHAPRKAAILELFELSLESNSLDSFVLLAQRQPVGVLIVGPLEDGTTIRTQYDLDAEPRRPGTDGTILSGVLSPVLEPHSRWYLRDIMRRSRYTTLFWICQPFAKGELGPRENLMSLAERMVPVRPRRALPNITGHKDLDRIYREVPTPFALWMIERPLSSYPKVYVNNGIVVVGASRTGLAFLESLILGPSGKYLTFPNVTLVSEHGLPTVADCLKAALTCIPHVGRYTDHYLKSVPFGFYLDIMPAVMVAIDRKKKCIHLKGGGIKCYDELVLTCGQQFQHPDYLKEPLEHVRVVRKGLPCERMLMDNPKYQPDRLPLPPELPSNVFLINSLLQANLVLRRLLKMMAEHRGALNENNRIIVYGDCLEAYCCISGLIELGVAGYDLCFVENFPPEDPAALRVNCFNDETVDERVQRSLESLGVQLIRKSRLVDWEISYSKVVSVHLMTPLRSIHVKCFALFYFGLKDIDINAFKAINECGLVYDGGLVVGPTFETNDAHIFAAGTCCNYSRRLYATNYLHRYYNSEDVGEALANLFLRKLDPFINFHPEFNEADLLPRYSTTLYSRVHPSIPELSTSRHLFATAAPGRKWQPVMKFESPIMKYAVLPGPLYYMRVRKPGIDIPMEVQMILPHQGHTLQTDKDEELFRLQLNVLHCVDAVTCLSRKPFSSQILSQLYGKHEAYFNKLLLRYQMQQINDLYAFFIQPWMAAIYQENFDDLITNINEHEIGARERSLGVRLYEPPKASDMAHVTTIARGNDLDRQLNVPYPKHGIIFQDNQIHDLLRSKYAFFGDELDIAKSKAEISTCFDTPECQEMKRRNTLRNVLHKFATRSSVQIDKEHSHPTDIPSECGQSAEMRDEVASFWDAMDGERIVFSYIARHIGKNSIANPHFAPPRPEYF